MRSTRTRRQRRGHPDRQQPQPRVDRASLGSDEDRRSRIACGAPRVLPPPGHTLEGRSSDWKRWCESTPSPEKALPDIQARPARTAGSANASDRPSPDRAGSSHQDEKQESAHDDYTARDDLLRISVGRDAYDRARPYRSLSRNLLARNPASPPRRRQTTAIGTATFHQTLPVSRFARSTNKHNALNVKAKRTNRVDDQRSRSTERLTAEGTTIHSPEKMLREYKQRRLGP